MLRTNESILRSFVRSFLGSWWSRLQLGPKPRELVVGGKREREVPFAEAMQMQMKNLPNQSILAALESVQAPLECGLLISN